ncbi:hypothetical protein MYU51_020407 [Penicillium brevicompactum]|uniref:HAT dimerization n=1 Tax=Penicillium brevicompactum TaxID=5074 RepID=UPI00253F8C72|nr:HAT dimerization [Penicillium brevicompactum]XP_056814240.1 HAT dimerization [Penicillium brevicompactum]KAJ5337532.1 HAT dimerization [Penicillium brevicompactum]KAJ5343429.1 HAT dimerization [Penicillium brevicompactum]
MQINRLECTSTLVRWHLCFVFCLLDEQLEVSVASELDYIKATTFNVLLLCFKQARQQYHDCIKDNDIYYIASVLDPRIKTKWLKTLPDGEKIIDRIREFLKRAYSTTKQPVSTTPNTNWKSFEYRFLKAFQPTQYNVTESDIDKYFDTPTISTGFDTSQSQSEFIRN